VIGSIDFVGICIAYFSGFREIKYVCTQITRHGLVEHINRNYIVKHSEQLSERQFIIHGHSTIQIYTTHVV
jgi:hypothetical protein